MSIKLLKLILWQGFERPKGVLENLLRLFNLLLVSILLTFYFVFLSFFEINLFLKLLIFLYFSINTLFLGCYFEGYAYLSTKCRFLRFIYGLGFLVIIFTNFFVTIYFLKNKLKNNEL